VRIEPSARRLIASLRDIGYDFQNAVADLVDNSIAAGATSVEVDLLFAGKQSSLRIADDGTGMTPTVLNEAMRFGTRRSYNGHDLGRFGLGLKTASISQCRTVSVAARAGTQRRRIHIRRLDLDRVAEFDRWEVEAPSLRNAPVILVEPLTARPGTVVLWESIDRVLEYRQPDGGWARRRFERLAAELSEHLGMVFHRFLSGEARRETPLRIAINGQQVKPWDPFARNEPATLPLRPRSVSIHRPVAAKVRFVPFVLPHRSAFSSPEAFERLAGPGKWNRQQGLYIYRGDRLIQGGGWAGIRSIDEHTKFARAAVEFDPALDELFKVNVAKMSVRLPAPVRKLLEPAISEVCRTASARYRRGEMETRSDRQPKSANGHLSTAGIALRAAAIETGDLDALDRIGARLRLRNSAVADQLRL